MKLHTLSCDLLMDVFFKNKYFNLQKVTVLPLQVKIAKKRHKICLDLSITPDFLKIIRKPETNDINC
jgi:hypothetical protein